MTFDELAAASGLARQTLLNLSAGRYHGEVQAWAMRDPLTRLRTHLTARGLLDEAREQQLAEGAETIAAALREALNTDAESIRAITPRVPFPPGA